MNFAKSVKAHNPTVNPHMKLTENGAVAYSTTSNDLLDLFATIGALRSRSEQEIEQKFAQAFALDPLLAVKMMFYAGCVRGGLGERRTFRICLHWLATHNPDVIDKNIELIPYFNRWDSLFVLVNTPCERQMWKYVESTLKDDLLQMSSKKPCSLLAKWMPSENATSEKTHMLAKRAIRNLKLQPRQYRKILSALRKYIDVTERKMSGNQWDKINYETVPSYAMKNYDDAFRHHDYKRFNDYLESVEQRNKKINASTIYPYDLVHQVWASSNRTSELQWKALPNYVEGENNILVMADVSGSMKGRPIETSIGMATYFAQRNKGPYHNLYMTFSSSPEFIELREGASLRENVLSVLHTKVGYSTNLVWAFDKILSHAVFHNIAQEDMPKALVVISDMEIDPFFRPGACWDFLMVLRKKFADKGYSLPKLILWNVESRHDTFLTTNEDVILVSGQSPSIFKNLCGALNGKTAWDFMLEVLNDKMYDCVKI